MGLFFSKLMVLFEHERSGPELQCFDFFRLMLRRWSGTSIRKRHQNWEAAIRLVDKVLDMIAE
jgi:hypothetical protein